MSEAALKRLRSWGAETGIILGSGLSSVLEDFAVLEGIAYSEFANFPQAGVRGHAGEFARADVNGKAILAAKGRVHLYEGQSAQAVTAGVRLLAAAGVKRVILTNAAGTANPDFAPGSWMMLRDHLNLTGTSPLVGARAFFDMMDVYSINWRGVFRQTADKVGIILHEGVYAGVLGPQYETPAEVRMLRTMGADAIGMSTVLEAIQARALGMEVVAFSCLTNWASGIGQKHLSHRDVLETGRAATGDFSRLLSATLR